MEDKAILKEFLETPIWTSDPIFNKFLKCPGAIFRHNPKNRLERFLFIEGKRDNKVVLVAHADTFFDSLYGYDKKHHKVIEKDGFFYAIDQEENPCGLGADDRAGCAILWLLKESGHSLLITDGEEVGRIGSTWLMNHHNDIADLINQHQFMIQFDRRNTKDFKCYEVGTPEFRNYIEQKTGYTEPDRFSYTDICTLCRDICGVNLSVGYYSEHSSRERIDISAWLNTLNITRKLLQEELPRFEI